MHRPYFKTPLAGVPHLADLWNSSYKMTLFLRFVIDSHISRPVSKHHLELVKFFCRKILRPARNHNKLLPSEIFYRIRTLSPSHHSPIMPPWTDLERSRLLLAMIELLVPPKGQNKLPPWAEVAERMGAGFTQDAVRYFSREKISHYPLYTVYTFASNFNHG